MRNLPRPGEDRLNLDLDPWAMHAQGMIIELLAGEAAERLAGFEVNPDACNSDKEKACLYARTLCVSDEPVLAYLTYATVEAETILNTLWRAVECCAEELLAKGTIGAEEIFEAIFRGEQLAALNEDARSARNGVQPSGGQ